MGSGFMMISTNALEKPAMGGNPVNLAENIDAKPLKNNFYNLSQSQHYSVQFKSFYLPGSNTFISLG